MVATKYIDRAIVKEMSLSTNDSGTMNMPTDPVSIGTRIKGTTDSKEKIISVNLTGRDRRISSAMVTITMDIIIEDSPTVHMGVVYHTKIHWDGTSYNVNRMTSEAFKPEDYRDCNLGMSLSVNDDVLHIYNNLAYRATNPVSRICTCKIDIIPNI